MDMGSYKLYVYKPDVIKKSGAVVYYHGGGFVVLDVENYNGLLSNMANQLGCVVFSPEYRLAPETPFPGGDTDVAEATKYIFENSEYFAIDPEKIVLTGDSAGGFFTLVTWYRLRDFFKQMGVQPSLLSFIYPALGYRFDSPSYQKNQNAPLLTRDDAHFYYLCHGDFERNEQNFNLLRHQLHFDWDKLSDDFKSRTDPWKWLTREQIGDAIKPNEAEFRKEFTPEEQKFRERMTKYVESVEWTPLSMSDEHLKQLPDCQFYTAQYDVLKNDGDILHARLKSLEKSSKMTFWEGSFHGQIMFGQQFLGLKNFPRSTSYVDDYIEKMQDYV